MTAVWGVIIVLTRKRIRRIVDSDVCLGSVGNFLTANLLLNLINLFFSMFKFISKFNF